jgi:hypothetical protein
MTLAAFTRNAGRTLDGHRWGIGCTELAMARSVVKVGNNFAAGDSDETKGHLRVFMSGHHFGNRITGRVNNLGAGNEFERGL